MLDIASKTINKNYDTFFSFFLWLTFVMMSLEAYACDNVGEASPLNSGKGCCTGLERMRLPDEQMGGVGRCAKVACKDVVGEKDAWGEPTFKLKVLIIDKGTGDQHMQIIKYNNNNGAEELYIKDSNNSAHLVTNLQNCTANYYEDDKIAVFSLYKDKLFIQLKNSKIRSMHTPTFLCNDEPLRNLLWQNQTNAPACFGTQSNSPETKGAQGTGTSRN